MERLEFQISKKYIYIYIYTHTHTQAGACEVHLILTDKFVQKISHSLRFSIEMATTLGYINKNYGNDFSFIFINVAGVR
jgi:hypothetical protein